MTCPTEEEIASFYERWQTGGREALEEMRLHFLECPDCMGVFIGCLGMEATHQFVMKNVASKLELFKKEMS